MTTDPETIEIEVWENTSFTEVFVPADPVRYPLRTRRIAAADWRYARTFLLDEDDDSPGRFGESRIEQRRWTAPAARWPAAAALLADDDDEEESDAG